MTDINFGDSKLSSMELYSLQIQKVMADFGVYDVVSKQYVDKQITDLVGGASGSLDTLKEIETYLTASGAEGGLVAQITALQGSLTAETAARLTADTTLQANITAVSSNLSAETSARQTSDVSHSASIATLTSGASAEASTRASADTVLTEELSKLSNKQATDKIATDNAISTEASSRASADSVLTADLASQVSKQALDKTDTDSAISNEISARESADTLLNQGLTALGETQTQDRTSAQTAVGEEQKRAEDEEQKIRDDVSAKDGAMDIRVDVFESKIDEDGVVGSVQQAVSRLRGGLQYLDNDRISPLEAKPYEGSGFGVGHNGVAEEDRKYLYFSDKWRLHGSADGSRLVFEYFHDAVLSNPETGQAGSPSVWKTAVPFISS
jgi:hypothetical protein